ncbi:hypothetical protein Dimus_020695, partial [Dionaea muscipula]
IIIKTEINIIYANTNTDHLHASRSELASRWSSCRRDHHHPYAWPQLACIATITPLRRRAHGARRLFPPSRSRPPCSRMVHGARRSSSSSRCPPCTRLTMNGARPLHRILAARRRGEPIVLAGRRSEEGTIVIIVPLASLHRRRRHARGGGMPRPPA